MLSFDLQQVYFSFIVVRSSSRSSDGLHLWDLVVSASHWKNMCFNLDPLVLHNDVILWIQLFWIAYQSSLFGGNTEVRACARTERQHKGHHPCTHSHRLLNKDKRNLSERKSCFSNEHTRGGRPHPHSFGLCCLFNGLSADSFWTTALRDVILKGAALLSPWHISLCPHSDTSILFFFHIRGTVWAGLKSFIELCICTYLPGRRSEVVMSILWLFSAWRIQL